VDENRPFLIILQFENDKATGEFFPIGTGLFKVMNIRTHWDKVPVPGSNGQKVSENEFYNHTPGNNKYLVNFHVVPLGETSPPLGLRHREAFIGVIVTIALEQDCSPGNSRERELSI
jgi:hypothetical protein